MRTEIRRERTSRGKGIEEEGREERRGEVR